MTLQVLGYAFYAIPAGYQWLMSFFLTVSHQLSSLVLTRLAHRAAGADHVSTEIVATNMVIVYHTFFLSIVVGSVGTDATCYLLIGIDFAMNMVATARIVRQLHRGNR